VKIGSFLQQIGRNLEAFFSEETTALEHSPKFLTVYDLDRVLLRLSQHDVWTLRDSFEGTQIFGATGSGKSSGSGATMARAFLKAGYGGLVLTVKTDEAQLWKDWLKKVGREQDLIHVRLESDWQFNFLEYEAKRRDGGGGLTENIVQLFLHIAEIQQRNNAGGKQDPYWHNTLEQLVRNSIELIRLAGESVSLTHLYKVIISAPSSPDMLKNHAFVADSFCSQLLMKAEDRRKDGYLAVREELDLELTSAYWMNEFPALAEKTRSIIVSSFTSLVDGLQRGAWRQLFSTGTNFGPEDTFEGKIILLDMPIKQYRETGLFAQIILKYIFQQAWERRHVNNDTRPVFLWADEAQYFVTSYDREFLTTARSSRIATVFITQNISNYYASLRTKGDGKAEVDALLGNLSTRIFHSNSDKITNEWAADSIGKDWLLRLTVSQSSSHSHTTEGWFSSRPDSYSTQKQESRSVTKELNYQILPVDFTRLLKGGTASNEKVEGIIQQSGRIWNANRQNYIRVQFYQENKK
jgi:hypothetical protein